MLTFKHINVVTLSKVTAPSSGQKIDRYIVIVRVYSPFVHYELSVNPRPPSPRVYSPSPPPCKHADYLTFILESREKGVDKEDLTNKMSQWLHMAPVKPCHILSRALPPQWGDFDIVDFKCGENNLGVTPTLAYLETKFF